LFGIYRWGWGFSTSQDFNGDIALIACFASSWTPAMVRRWHADPFGFLRPWHEVPALMGSAPPSTPPSTGNSSLLKEMIDKTAFSISTDESKYNLNGIYFRSVEDEGKQMLRLVATDGHRLSMIQKEMDASHVEELLKGVIFPRKGIIELKKIAEEGESDIQLGFMDNNAVVKKDRTVVVMRLVDGEFPDYNRVIPKNNELVAFINRDTFLHALRRMAILSSEKSRGVKVMLRQGMLEISSSNPEFGDAKEDLEIEYGGPDMSIGFNARYLIDILQAQETEKVRLLVKDNLSPGLVKPSEESNYLAVVMPMRL
jgi:DNA polymerase-3 subunit beta